MGDIVDELKEQSERQKPTKAEKLAEDAEVLRLEIELAELQGVRDKPAELKAKEFELATREAELDKWVALVELVVADEEDDNGLFSWQADEREARREARWAKQNKSKEVRND